MREGQARGVQAMMTLIVIGTVQGGEREGDPRGFMKRGGSGGRQPEEEEERVKASRSPEHRQQLSCERGNPPGGNREMIQRGH